MDYGAAVAHKFRTRLEFKQYDIILTIECKLAVQIYENGYSDRNIDCKIKTQKAIEQKLGCMFLNS